MGATDAHEPQERDCQSMWRTCWFGEPRRNRTLENNMTRPLSDAGTVTRTALFGGAETWFDAFWYRETPEVRQGRVGKAARLLRDRIVAARIGRPGWQAESIHVFAMTDATMTPSGRRF